MDRRLRQRRPADERRAVESERVPFVVFPRLQASALRRSVQELSLAEIERSITPSAESSCCRDHLVQNGLEPFGPGHRGEHCADRPLLLARVLEPARELRSVRAYVNHSRSSV
jgi:hypothetical protein